MEREDQVRYVARYTERYQQFGYAPETLGWGKGGRQEIRFSALLKDLLQGDGLTGSVLDVGCGFADLFAWLQSQGWQGKYVGIDLVPVLIAEAGKRYPELELHTADLTTFAAAHPERCFDYVVASGIFNARLTASDNETHIRDTLTAMFRLSRIAVAADFMSTWVDFQHPDAWHTDPHWLLGVVRQMTRRFILRYDFMPYEFAVILYCGDQSGQDHVFSECKREI